jgi:hypothetical protein
MKPFLNWACKWAYLGLHARIRAGKARVASNCVVQVIVSLELRLFWLFDNLDGVYSLSDGIPNYMGNVTNLTDMQVKQCDNGSYCCGTDNQAVNATATRCCQEGNGFFLHDGTITQANGTASTSQATPTTLPETSANGTSSTTSPTATATPVPPKKSDIGAIVGGTIGGLAALSILAAIIVLSLRRSRRRKQQETPAKELGAGSHVTHELHSKAVPWEMGDTERIEKDGTPVRAIR